MRIGIIGGGIAGLTAAYRLSQAGHNVTVFERRKELGGQAATFEVAGNQLEIFYHHIFTNDSYIIQLIDELGLGDRLQWLESKVGFYHGAKIYDFVTPTDLLRFSPISLLDRVRLGLVGVYLQRYKNWQRLERITAKDWIKKYAGKRNFEVVWGPLLRGKFGSSYEQVGMVWFWGKIFIRFASRGKGMQKERLGYLMGSFGQVTDALAQRITDVGGIVHTQSDVKRVLVEGGRVNGLEVSQRDSSGEVSTKNYDFDAVIATVPSPVFLNMVPELSGDYAEKLRQMRYQSASCLVLVLKKSLSPIYWLNISDPSIPFVAAIEHTNFIDRSNYNGKHMLYLSNYMSTDDPLYRAGPDELLEAYLPHLKKLNPDFERGWIEDYRLFRDDAGQPIVTTNYSQKIADHHTPIGGLYLANTTQIYPEDRGMNYSVRLGERISKLVASGA